MWEWQGQHGDDRDNVHVVPAVPMLSLVETTETTTLGTTWGPSGGYGDDVGMMGMMWGPWGPCGDNKEKIFDLLAHLQPIKIAAEIKTKCKIWLKCQFSHTTVNHRKIFNAPLDVLMCPLQIINDSEPLSSTLHGVNARFIHHPSNVKNYLIGHKLETDRPKPKKKKILFWTTYF